jgi:hypothetical protein
MGDRLLPCGVMEGYLLELRSRWVPLLGSDASRKDKEGPKLNLISLM